MQKLVSISILLLSLTLCEAPTGNEITESSSPPSLAVPRATGEIAIDGDLTDPGWLGAASVRNFTQYRPIDDVRPSVETEVLITYDEANLYLAFVCQDDPATIRATLTDRDRMFSDDFIGIILDTYGNAAWAYEFYVNPLGIQGDLRWVANSDEDWRFDLIYTTEAKITENGWQAEMSIPFSSLRFPQRPQQVWRATFWRSHPRDNVYKYSWAPLKIGEPCFFCQFGYLTGIEGVEPGSRLDVLPSVVSSQSGERQDPDDRHSPFDNSNPESELALNARYRLSPDLTTEAAFNPDFSQVESDAAQIDVNTTFALFYPERRPFFQEGSDLYGTYINAIYTRSVNDPDFAVKLTGRMNRSSFFYLAARDANSPYMVPMEERSSFAPFGRSFSNVARFRQAVRDDSYVGALVTDRRLDGGGSSSVYGTDLGLRFLGKYRFKLHALGSYTKEPDDPMRSEEYLPDTTFDGGAHTTAFDGETFSGHAVYASIERDARLWSFDVSVKQNSPTFRAGNGFVTRNDFRRIDTWNCLAFRPNGKIVTSWNVQASVGRMWNFRNVRKDEWIRSTVNVNLRQQTHVMWSGLLSREMLRGVWFDDIRMMDAHVCNHAFGFLESGFDVSYGNTIARNVDPKPVMGRTFALSTWAGFKPLKQVSIEPSLSYFKLKVRDTGEKLHEGAILRTRLDYQLTRELSVRAIVQYNDFATNLMVEPLVTYKINPFSAFYIGSNYDLEYEAGQVNYPRKNARQFFLKFQYLFRT